MIRRNTREMSNAIDATGESAANLKILFLINGFQDHGGAEIALATLVDALSNTGTEVHLASLLGDGPLPSLTKLPQENVVSFGMRHGAYWDLASIVRLHRHIRKHRFDVVCTHLEFANTVGVLVSRLAGVPGIVPVTHSMRPKRNRRRIWMNRILARLAGRYLTVSASILNHLTEREGLPPDRVGLLRSAVDLSKMPESFLHDRAARRQELGLPIAGPVIFHAGSMRKAKRQEDLIEAAAKVRSVYPAAKLVLAGDGPRRAELEELAKRSLPDGGAIFLGHRRDVPSLVAACDVSVLSSMREGLPVIVLESFAVGTPMVATDVGGVGELIRDGETGSLVPPGAPDALAAAIVEVLRDPFLRIHTTTSARDLVEHRYDAPAVAAHFLTTVREVLEARERSGNQSSSSTRS